MGCISCKSSVIESRDSPTDRMSSKATSDSQVPRSISSRREEGVRIKDRPEERKREKTEYYVIPNNPGMRMVPKAMEGLQVAAGWPSGWRQWLVKPSGVGSHDERILLRS